jgi:hypothetical protein
MVDVAQLVRVADCGSVGRGFEPHLPPKIQKPVPERTGFLFCSVESCSHMRKKRKAMYMQSMETGFCIFCTAPQGTMSGPLLARIFLIRASVFYQCTDYSSFKLVQHPADHVSRVNS